MTVAPPTAQPDPEDPWAIPVQPEDPWAAPVRPAVGNEPEPATTDYPTRPPQPHPAEAPTGTFTGSDVLAAPPAPSATPPSAGRRAAPRAVLIATGAVSLAVVVAGWLVPGFWRTRVLDVHATEERVTYVLTDPAKGYGLTDVTDVVCNNGADPVARSGGTFTCEATVGEHKMHVEVTTPDTSGVFWVGPPAKS